MEVGAIHTAALDSASGSATVLILGIASPTLMQALIALGLEATGSTDDGLLLILGLLGIAMDLGLEATASMDDGLLLTLVLLGIAMDLGLGFTVLADLDSDTAVLTGQAFTAASTDGGKFR